MISRYEKRTPANRKERGSVRGGLRKPLPVRERGENRGSAVGELNPSAERDGLAALPLRGAFLDEGSRPLDAVGGLL